MSDYIRDGFESGGATTSSTIVFPALCVLLGATRRATPIDEYERLVVDDNLLGSPTQNARKRMFRTLRELYVLRPDTVLFRSLRDLWDEDPAAQPLLAGMCALARDSVFRASFAAIRGTTPGDELEAGDLAEYDAFAIETEAVETVIDFDAISEIEF